MSIVFFKKIRELFKLPVLVLRLLEPLILNNFRHRVHVAPVTADALVNFIVGFRLLHKINSFALDGYSIDDLRIKVNRF